MKKGFTLIELIMVIVIIAILSTLAVNKVGGLREMAARKVSLSNQQAVGRAVETFLTAEGRLNRLDSLVYADNGGAPKFGSKDGFIDMDFTSTVDGREAFYLGPSADCTAETRHDRNEGLTPGLVKVITPYALSKAEATSLATRLGLQYVMAHTAYADAAATAFPATHYPKDRAYGDGSVPNASDGLTPNDSACVATCVTNRMLVAAINPKTDLGRTIYQACGQDLLNTKNWGESYTEEEVKKEVSATGGPLLAFGLGDACSIIGKAKAGLEAAPYAAYPQKQYYSRYIVLIRLRTLGGGSVSVIQPEFAGVLDPCGNTIRGARHILKDL